MRYLLLALLLGSLMAGCGEGDDMDSDQAGAAQQGGNRPSLGLTVCFERPDNVCPRATGAQ